MAEPRKAIVHIINRFKVKDPNQAFHCILIYQDLQTKFCFVRALLYKMNVEIAMELFKIFTSYGPPAQLLVNSCTNEMVSSVGQHLVELCPMFHVTLCMKHGEHNHIAMKVVTELHKWMETTKKDEWEIGCSIIQRQLNSQSILGVTIQETHFKHLAQETDSEQIVTTGVTSPPRVKSEPIDEHDNIDSEESTNTLRCDTGKNYSSQVRKPNSVKNSLNIVNKSKDSVNNSKVSANNSIDSVNNSANTVNVKQETVSSIKNEAISFEGGLIFPTRSVSEYKVKLERLEE